MKYVRFFFFNKIEDIFLMYNNHIFRVLLLLSLIIFLSTALIIVISYIRFFIS